MNVLVSLAAILFVLMILIGGKKGARSFIALFLNFAVLFLTIILMTDPHIDPIILTLISSTVISCVTLFYINEVNIKTITAFISTLITIIILLFFILAVTKKTMIQGFGEEELGDLGIFTLFVGVNFVKITAAMIIMSTIGSITDVAISITSPMREILIHKPFISRKDLFKFGLSIGRDILGTNTNTLFFAFFGNYLALLLWFKDLSYSFGKLVNSKVFSAEMVTILCAGIGIGLIIPITSWISAYFLEKTTKNNKTIK
ncbi:YibE/F [Bacillus nakamurai]|uniref:YibE/F family protein n=1 Tax=Bacillus nakamurai TaxID=1793963 RepID=UPI0007784066|nr:YibE/F family protein [Bacillus nakamurai]KXZ23580.1 YibE/F [Bacillus nakamurai]